MIPPRGLLALAAIVAVAVAACGGTATPTPAPATPITTAAPTVAAPTAAPTPAPTATAAPTPTATPAITPGPTPPRTPAPTPAAPSPGANTPTADTFWGFVEHGLRDAARLEVAIAGPNAGTLRYEADASATVIEGVVGFVCLGHRAYDGQSGFSAIPGSWTCGAAALVAGFRTIGQPLDAWNATLPSDDARRETVTVRGETWTWSYRATSPYYGGRVTAVVTLDRTSLRVTAATRQDPTGVTTYTFRYRADFPAIAVPR